MTEQQMEETVEKGDGQDHNTNEYSPQEIQEAMGEEGGLGTQALLQQAQQRNLVLNIETRRAQTKVAKLEEENRLLRSIIRDFEAKDAVSPVVERYLEQARQAEEDKKLPGDDDGLAGVPAVV